jgi:chitodextrinase
MTNATVISDSEIRHRSDTRGVVITRVQKIEVNGRTFEARYWTQFETGALDHIDSVEVS